MKVAVIFTNYGPYHLTRLRSAAHHGGFSSCIGLEIAAQENLYPWQTQRDTLEVELETLYTGALESAVPKTLCQLVNAALERHQPDVVAIGGYERAEMRAALWWCKRNGKIAVLMSESKSDDAPRSRLKEALKSLLVRRFDAGLVGGQPHLDYLLGLGIPAARIFMGYDVVDNQRFAENAQKWRTESTSPLTRPYFLTVNRFVERKNLRRVIESYALYRQKTVTPWDLVLCGGGEQEAELQAVARATGLDGIHFTGFLQQDEINRYMAFAGIFIHASLVEQWGLVVNEAMACGLPVLLSRTCGSASELLREGENGWGFDPESTEDLATKMEQMSAPNAPLPQWSEASSRIIAGWGPERFGQGLFEAAQAARR
ncbi:MAG TPA: glycosyltransferase family 4 protein [Abditibacterium sp.]|jgi:glycosyltransferase involved in cell wall biosynthesis